MRAVYDHANDQPGSRRRREAADWGVGDELFDHLPGRRFDRRDAGHEAAASHGHESVAASHGHEVVAAREVVAPRELVPADRGREPVSAGGRRTVKINGRPGERHAPYVARRRPPRTVGERLGTRPDRIAYWAFALGMLLIVVAIATSLI
jgi:hypothetical protein